MPPNVVFDYKGDVHAFKCVIPSIDAGMTNHILVTLGRQITLRRKI